MSMQFLAEGVGGCLYPTDLFSDAVALLDVGIIQRTCPNNDDLWLKAMQLMLDIPVVAAGSGKNLDNVPGSQKLALWHYNIIEGGTDYEWLLILREMEKRYGKGIFINKLLKPSKGEDFLGRDNLHRLLIGERNYYGRVLSQVQGFRIGAYLKYKFLSKLTLGGMRVRYRKKYQEQKRIYRAIRRGRLDF